MYLCEYLAFVVTTNVTELVQMHCDLKGQQDGPLLQHS